MTKEGGVVHWTYSYCLLWHLLESHLVVAPDHDASCVLCKSVFATLCFSNGCSEVTVRLCSSVCTERQTPAAWLVWSLLEAPPYLKCLSWGLESASVKLSCWTTQVKCVCVSLRMNKCLSAHRECITKLVYLYERAPVLVMPQPFTVHCLLLLISIQRRRSRVLIMLHNKVKSSLNLHSRLPAENHYQYSWSYTKGHTDFFFFSFWLTCRHTLLNWVTESQGLILPSSSPAPASFFCRAEVKSWN